MKRIFPILLASALLAWNVSAQEMKPSSERGEKPEKAQKAQQEQKKGSGAPASGKGSASASTSASAQAGQNSASLSNDTTIEASLVGSLDARKNKEGDPVVARTTHSVKQDGKVVIPKGAKLIGHVTQAKARAKGESESELGIMFDHAVLKNGQEMPVHLAIQALAAAQTATTIADGDTSGMASGSAMGGGHASGGGGLVGGATSSVGAVTNTAGGVAGGAAGTAANAAGGTVGAATSTAGSAAGSAAGANVGGVLTTSSTGVIGLQGLSLSSAASHETQGSLIVSSTKNVHLDSGTRMLLRARGQ